MKDLPMDSMASVQAREEENLSSSSMDEGRDEWFLEEVFTLHPKCTVHYQCRLDARGLSYRRMESGEREWTMLRKKDIIGCVCMHERASIKKNHSHFYLSVYAYPLKGKLFSKGQRRLRYNLVFKVDVHPGDRAANLALAKRWTDAIIALARGVDHDENDSSVLRRHLLIMVNPHSGAGRALLLFRQRVVPILAEAAVSYELIITEHQNYAFNYVKNADLSKWSGIVTASGDGLLYEVINGIMDRSDWEKAIKTPLGIIPGGSGNGLAIAISHALKYDSVSRICRALSFVLQNSHVAIREPADTHHVLFGALTIVKGLHAPMDLIRVETPKKVMYSFLSVGWGIMSDIDIESERLRVIGGSRFTVWAVARVIGLRLYRGRVSFLRVDGYTKIQKNLKRTFGVNNHSKSFPASLDQAHRLDSPESDWTHSTVDVSMPSSKDTDGSVRDGVQSKPSAVPAVAIEMPPLHEPVPSNWETIEDDFVAVHTSSQSHIGNGVYLAPEATLNDGLIWMVIVRNGISRPKLVEFLLSLESGSHVDLPYVDVFPVHAFRIEPEGSGGFLTVDGEIVDYGPIQAKVMPSLARVMTL